MHHRLPCSRANTTPIRHANINGRVINTILHIIYNNKKSKIQSYFCSFDETAHFMSNITIRSRTTLKISEKIVK